ncbi:MAG: alpha/beta fold hydrolase [Nitrospirales bacterium]
MPFSTVTFPSNAQSHTTPTISNKWEIVAIVLLVLWTIGCTNVRSEQLRGWERHERKTNLLVFVHGFNSSKEQAWGSFIPLIKDDKDFSEYDILSYGYPQEICGQTNDIRDVGAHLKSDLTEELPKYDTTIFVGHSMGGLVILNALLELGDSNATLISNKLFLVMTLGTPYYGAERASIFGTICRNPQGEAMQVLTNEGARLVRDWQQRSTIPVYPFHGLKDELVKMASACGIAPPICESLDGDHALIAKPLDREHLAYKKLQSMKDKAGVKVDDIKVLSECDHKDFIKMIPAEGGPYAEVFFHAEKYFDDSESHGGEGLTVSCATTVAAARLGAQPGASSAPPDGGHTARPRSAGLPTCADSP